MLNFKNAVTEKHNYLFLLQVKAHVVFGGSNIFELQLNLHGVSCNLKLLWKSWLGNPIYKKSNQCEFKCVLDVYVGMFISWQSVLLPFQLTSINSNLVV